MYSYNIFGWRRLHQTFKPNPMHSATKNLKYRYPVIFYILLISHRTTARIYFLSLNTTTNHSSKLSYELWPNPALIILRLNWEVCRTRLWKIRSEILKCHQNLAISPLRLLMYLLLKTTAHHHLFLLSFLLNWGANGGLDTVSSLQGRLSFTLKIVRHLTKILKRKQDNRWIQKRSQKMPPFMYQDKNKFVTVFTSTTISVQISRVQNN